jgi:hypothetical protein
MRRLMLAILLSGLSAAGSAEEPTLGRLFLTPEQRAALDSARRNKIRAEAVVAAADKKPKTPPARSVTINGVVSRSDGESTIWVNGHATEGQTEDGMRVAIAPGSNSSVVVREPAKGKHVRLKVGQRADLLSGKIEESYQQRRATPTASPGASSPSGKNPDLSDAKPARTPRGEAEREEHAAQNQQDNAAPADDPAGKQ